MDLFNFYIFVRARTCERKQSNNSVSSILQSPHSTNYFFPSKPSKMEKVYYTDTALSKCTSFIKYALFAFVFINVIFSNCSQFFTSCFRFSRFCVHCHYSLAVLFITIHCCKISWLHICISKYI